MKKVTLLVFLLNMFFLLSTAQTLMPCLHDLGVHVMEENHPGYRQSVTDAFQNVKKSIHSRTGEIYTIPVVVHVVWDAPEKNIPMTQIEDQIEEMNRCFRRQNADTVNLRSVFEDVAGDPMIEFFLYDVVRTKTTAEFEPSLAGLPDNVKQTAFGGSDPYDTEHFLNIWICEIQPLSIFGTESPVLGYAYPPADLANWPAGSNAPSKELEGVVIDYRVFGTDLTFTFPQIGDLLIKGRTTVHEVGHYLGLRHISGDGLSAQIGLPDCDADDGIDDTPNQGMQSAFNCDMTQNSCTDLVNDRPDMIENFMDYSTETCQNTFTKDQIDIMRGVLEGPRSGLLEPVTSTTSPDLQNVIGIYPNPFNTTITVDFNDQVEGDYFLTNLLGERIATGKVSNEQLHLNLSNIESGIYNFTIRTKGGIVLTKRLVKIR